MSDFLDYYRSEVARAGGISPYIARKASEKRLLLDCVRASVTNGRVLEAGCGSAANSIYLSRLGLDVTCVDIDPEMIEFARFNAKCAGASVRFVRCDIGALPFPNGSFDVVFSHGVLEHFHDTKIAALVDEALRTAPTCLISVPTDFFSASCAIAGDERFMSPSEWNRILGLSRGQVIETFSYFHESSDWSVRWRKLAARLSFQTVPIRKPYLGLRLVDRNADD